MIPDYFSKRKTVRNFQKKNISDEKIKEILEVAMRAPTCGNMQLYSIIITKEEENKRKLEALHYNQPAATTSSVILTVCADFKRFTQWCNHNEANPGYDNFHSFIMSLTDALIYAQQIVTIAELEGFSTCYLGTVNYNAKEISELLNLPDLVIPVASIAIGIAEKEESQVERLPIESIIHEESYRDLSDDRVSSYFKIHEESETNKKFVEEAGKKNLAELFTTMRYPKELNEKVSESFLNLIREKGFLQD